MLAASIARAQAKVERALEFTASDARERA